MESLRVDATLLAQSSNKTVRIIGQLKSLDTTNSSASLDSNGLISVSSSSNTDDLVVDNWYEVIGVVQKDLSVNVLQWFDFGKDFNANAAKKLVEVVHRVPELYHS